MLNWTCWNGTGPVDVDDVIASIESGNSFCDMVVAGNDATKERLDRGWTFSWPTCVWAGVCLCSEALCSCAVRHLPLPPWPANLSPMPTAGLTAARALPSPCPASDQTPGERRGLQQGGQRCT